jgi:hypothetical protein
MTFAKFKMTYTEETCFLYMGVASIEQSAPLSELANSNLFSKHQFSHRIWSRYCQIQFTRTHYTLLDLFFCVSYIVSIHKQSGGSRFVSTMKRNHSDNILLLNYDIKVITNYFAPSLVVCA